MGVCVGGGGGSEKTQKILQCALVKPPIILLP